MKSLVPFKYLGTERKKIHSFVVKIFSKLCQPKKGKWRRRK